MDPLEQLKDIHLPQEIHNYPIALGWWLLALFILMLIIFSSLKIRQGLIKRKAKKLALKKLTDVNDATSAIKILKWTLLQYFPRQQVAHLSGKSLQAFLNASIPIKQQATFQQLCQNGFDTVYQRPANTDKESSKHNIVQATTLWLKHTLPPRKELLMENSLSLVDVPLTSNLLPTPAIEKDTKSDVLSAATPSAETKNVTTLAANASTNMEEKS